MIELAQQAVEAGGGYAMVLGPLGALVLAIAGIAALWKRLREKDDRLDSIYDRLIQAAEGRDRDGA